MMPLGKVIQSSLWSLSIGQDDPNGMKTWISAIVCVVVAGLFSICYRGKYRKPPGPWGLPILGHLHMLGALPHQSLHKLALRYGPIFSIQLGLVPAVVVSSSEVAELVLKTHDLVFATRPKVEAAEYISYGQRNMGSGFYGPSWRNLRKLCTLHLLSNSKVEATKPARKDYVQGFVRWVVDQAEARNVVDLTAKVESVIEDMTFAMVIGRGKNDFDLKSSIDEIMKLASTFNLSDYIPFIGAFDIQGLRHRLKMVSKVVDGFLENIINEHERDANEKKDNQSRDFIDTMLSLIKSNNAEEDFDRDTIKAIVIDMIAGAMHTSSSAIEWVLAELLNNPKVMERVQSELEDVIGLDRMVEESDLVKLEYLDLVIKESMRLHPVGPLLPPHEAMEDITIKGYYIPKKARILVNVWAIGRDPLVWSDNVNEFYPERFIGSNMDFRGQDSRFIPFGSGRRGCPGLQLGITVVRLVVAQLVHCFNWELPDGILPGDLDMDEKFALTMPRANHLLAKPSFRLHSLES